MIRSLAAIAALAFALSAVSADAKSCRDAHGKFMKCAPPMAQHCRDIKTKRFAKCGDSHTEPMPDHPH